MKDKRQRTTFPFPCDPTFTAYLIQAAAASGYPHYFPPAASSLGAYQPYTTGLPAAVSRYTPYPVQTAIRSAAVPPLLHAPYHRPVGSTSPPSSPYTSLLGTGSSGHLASCPVRESGKLGSEGCICNILYPGLFAHSLSHQQQQSLTSSSPLQQNFSKDSLTPSVSRASSGSPPTPATSGSSPPLRPSLFQPYKDEVVSRDIH